MTEVLVPGLAGRANRSRGGATRESHVGGELDRIACRTIRILHDRRIPGSRAAIDHLAVTPAGIWVIGATRHSGRPGLRVEGGVLRPRVETLLVGGHDRTALVGGLLRQADAVRAAVDAPVHAALCFVDADWPLLGGSFRIRGVEVLWPRRLADLLGSTRERGSAAADVADVSDLAARTASRFPEA